MEIDTLNVVSNLGASDLTALDVVSQVQSFYELAFQKLMIITSVLGAAILFVLPYFLEKRQKELYKSELKSFKKELEEFKIKSEEDLKSITHSTKNELLVSSANIYHEIADNSISASTKQNLFYYLVATQYYITANQYLFADNILDKLLQNNFNEYLKVGLDDFKNLKSFIETNKNYLETSLMARKFISTLDLNTNDN